MRRLNFYWTFLLVQLSFMPCACGFSWWRWVSRRPSVCIGPNCGVLGSNLEIVEDELTVYERWREHSTEEPVTFYSQYEDESNEHIARRGLLITRSDARATILVLHGYTSSKIDMGILRLLFSPYNLLLFDFRAHGEHIFGQASTLGCDEVYDVLAAVDFLRSHARTKNLPIIAYGFSMGAVTAIEAQSRDKHLFDAMVLDCPFDSTDALVKRGLDEFWGRIHIPILNIDCALPGRAFLERHYANHFVQRFMFFLLRVFAGMDTRKIPVIPKKVNSVTSARKIDVPVFLIGCYADQRVPVDAFVRVYAEFGGYKRLWITRGARHFGSLFNNPELYQQMVINFIEKVLAKTFDRERRARVMVDMSRDDLQHMHYRLYKYPLDLTTWSVLFPASEP